MINVRNLNDEELKLAIELIPKKQRLDFVKLHSKKFTKIIKGAKVDYSSKLLEQRIANTFFERVKEQDIVLINYINKLLFDCIYEVNRNFSEFIDNDEELSSVLGQQVYIDIPDDSLKINKQIGIILKTKEKKYYRKMVLNLLNYIEAKYIDTYFFLNDIKLKVRENAMLKESIEEAIILKTVEKKVKKDTEKKCEDEKRVIEKCKYI